MSQVYRRYKVTKVRDFLENNSNLRDLVIVSKDENGRFHVFDLDRNFNDEIIEDEEIVLNPNMQKSYAFHHGGEDDDNYDDWGYDSDD